MSDSIINIMALVFLCLGVMCIFFKRDILKEETSRYITTTSGFVVSLISLLVIYYFNR